MKLVLLIGLSLLMLACGGAAAVAPTLAPTVAPVATVAAAANPEARVRQVAEQALGAPNRDIPRVATVTAAADQLAVQFALDQHSTDEDIRDLGYIALINLTAALKAAGYTDRELYLVGTLPAASGPGEIPVLKAWIGPAKLAATDWANLTYDRFPAAVDTLWKHPTLP